MSIDTNEDISQILGLIVAISYAKISEKTKNNKDLEVE